MNPENPTENITLKDLHRDFQITEDGVWYFNRDYNPFTDEAANIKAKVFFENPSLLDDCEFLAKIAVNKDSSAAFPYICFAYGRDDKKRLLEEWAKKFPHAEIILGLNPQGVMTNKSKVVVLKDSNKKE